MIEFLVKTLGRNAYRINVNLNDKVADVKRAIEIETTKRANVYPAARLDIVHGGKILEDETKTLKENGVTEKSYLIILKPPKERGSGGKSLSASAEKLESESNEAPAAVEAPLDAAVSLIGQCTDSAAQTTQPREPASTGINVTPLNLFPQAHGTGLSTNEGRNRDLNQLTSSECEAVDRLVALGFSRVVAMEAFLACDRNEEQAANYLIDNIGDI